MNSVSQYRYSYLEGVSWKAGSPEELLSANSEYDVAILASSWDTRSVCLTACKHLKVETFLVLMFTQRDSGGLRDAHDAMLRDFADKLGTYVPLHGSSTQLFELWGLLRSHLTELRHKKGRALRIMVDISACPRYYTLGLLSLGFISKVASRFSLFYAEGKYPDPGSQLEIAFTGGKWRALPAPGLEGKFRPEKRRFFLVSAGFEGWKALRVLAKADPDRVSLLFPDPGVIERYAERTRRDNQSLIDQYIIPEEQILKAEAGDAIGAWKMLSERMPEQPDTENCYFLCCGTKPHAVALGLRAIATKHPAVLYAQPDEHKVVPVVPSGIYWRFDVSDVTAIA